jgi:hypothetical protein
MGKYDEMKAVAIQAQKNWRDRNERARQFILTLVTGWKDYCNIPADQIEYLRSDRTAENERRFKRARDGGKYDPLQAIAYDEEEDEWDVGLFIAFSRIGVSPELNVRFGIFVTERQGKFHVRIGSGESRTIDLNIQAQRLGFYENLLDDIKDAFKTDTKPKTKVLGFALSVE